MLRDSLPIKGIKVQCLSCGSKSLQFIRRPIPSLDTDGTSDYTDFVVPVADRVSPGSHV